MFSRTAAEILKRFTHSDVFGMSVTLAAGTSRVEHGVPAQAVTLFWPTFKAAADEADQSRSYGGIHFVQADVDARNAGPSNSEKAWNEAQTYFKGKHEHGDSEFD